MAIDLNELYIKRIGFIEPPGCQRDVLAHPFDSNKTVEVAVFKEHRFAFFYWLKWTVKLGNKIPSLVSFDWHQDLSPPYSDELPELKNLDTDNKAEVALYTWAKLSPQNDVQIRAAIMLNKIKDVYLICRQNCSRPLTEVITDFYGNSHTIRIFKSIDEFETHLPKIEDKQIYFDIDLDYFTLNNPLSVGGGIKKQQYTYVSKSDVVKTFAPDTLVMKWILERLAGFTIATEPEFCGSLKKSNFFLNIIDNLYFQPSLFHNIPGNEGTKWRNP